MMKHSCTPDQIEAGTFSVLLQQSWKHFSENVIPKHLEAISAKLVEAGCTIEEFDDAVCVISMGNYNTQ